MDLIIKHWQTCCVQCPSELGLLARLIDTVTAYKSIRHLYGFTFYKLLFFFFFSFDSASYSLHIPHYRLPLHEGWLVITGW